MENLETCPFCGGTVNLWETGIGVVTVFQCQKCRAMFVFPWDKTVTAEEKGKAFNRRVTPSVNAVRELIDVERQKVPQNPAIHPKSKAFSSGVEHGMRMAFDVAEEICGKVEFAAGNNTR